MPAGASVPPLADATVRRMRRQQNQRLRPSAGVTLMEMLVVVTIVSLMIGIAVPAFQAGLPAIRLRSAASSVAQFLNASRNQVDREQRAVLVRIYLDQRILSSQGIPGSGAPPQAPQVLELPDGISIEGVFPAPMALQAPLREYILYPGGTVPPIAVHLRNDRGAVRWVSLDPITSVARVSPVQPQPGGDAALQGARP